MDYVTIHKLIEANGYKKVTTKSRIISFTTNYIKDNDRITVNWQMGGYVKSIIHVDISGKKILFETAKKFIETFF